MALSPFRRFVGRVAVGALALAVPVAMTPVAAAAAAPPDLFISEYVEGLSNNKAVEIYNGTGAAVDLTAGSYSLTMHFNGNAAAGTTVNLTGTVAAGDTHVLAGSAANATILALADQTSTSSFYNGDDAVVLRKAGAAVDFLGQVGFDPGTEWGTGLTSTADNTLRRQADVCAGDVGGSNPFDPSVEWDGFATDTFAGLGAHTADCGPVTPPVDAAPTVASTTPASGTTAGGGVNPTVTFSEPVALASGAISLVCSVSGPVPVSVTGGPTAYTVDPTPTLVDGDECSLTVAGQKVTDVDTNDPPDTMAADVTTTFTVADVCTASYTPIPQIQGSGSDSPVIGSTRTTRGVVVGDYEGAAGLRGFYLQDPTGDGDPATSDAIFVFNGGNQNVVALGDRVTVTGTVAENFGQTQISTNIDRIAACGTGTVGTTDVTLPMASATAFEKYEGMLVRMPQELTVTEHFQLGRFGEVLLSSGGRLAQPTNVVAPGAPALALQAANDLNQVFVDDGNNAQNADPIVFGRGGQPLSASNTLRGGDTTTGTVGVMTYTFGGSTTSSPNAYRVRPVNALGGTAVFQPANPRPTSAPDVGGAVQVAGMNLLNYFNTFDGLPDRVDNCTGGSAGAPTDCRGADDQAEFDRQTAKTVAAIAKIDADVIGVNEIENDGYGPQSAIATLVDAVNARLGAGTYAFLDVDALTGQVDAMGDDAIKVGFLYKPAAVTLVGDTAALNTQEFVTGGDSGPRNRPSLAQAWRSTETGGVFVTDVNHLKSKGSQCDVPDAGDGQANCAQVRTNSVRTLLRWLASDPTGTGDEDVLLVGDLNSYAKETPITTLEEGGFTNLVEKYQGEDAYSYVFDGQWGYLDHALGSPTLTSQVTGVADYHINADEPAILDYNTNFKTPSQVGSLYAPDEYRVSDHDPVLVGLTPLPSYDTAGLEGPLAKDGRVVKAGSTLPVKVTFTAADGSVPTDLAPVVRIALDGEVVLTGTATFVDGHWQFLLRTGTLPDPRGSYTVTVLVPETGQTVTGSFLLRP